MKIIDIERKDIDYKDYIQRSALLSDVSTLIKEDCIIRVNGVPEIFYTLLSKDDLKNIRWAVKNIKYSKSERTGGLKTQSKIFGYSPRNPLRNDYCNLTTMSESEGKQHKVITEFGKVLSNYYKDYMTDDFNKHQQVVIEKVKPDWIISGTPFTSGIVNKNNPLKYHLDSGNFKGLMSNMLVLKKDVDGGFLVIPELDIALECPDGSLVIFNGQRILHGVSPIENKYDTSYRYSVVYYSLEQMWKCETMDEEIARVRSVKMKRANNRIDEEHIERLKQTKEIKKKRWIDSIYDLTPVEKVQGIYFKREDKFSPSDLGVNGSKMRQCLFYGGGR